ncbi:hypothetical protein C8J56DRAFT_767806 [Mycena floridula]|nr:hypothetical protein C8J56DRAFT_767806 [Mycena floridula]
MPELAQTTYGRRIDDGTLWRRAQRILPEFRQRITDTVEDPFDRCSSGPFVLAHMDFNPENIIFASEGPNAGKIVSVIDWELAATVPLWSLICYPLWFSRSGSRWFRKRDPKETEMFKATYVRELQKYTTNSFILRIVQNERSERRKSFADTALQPWISADEMQRWMDNNPRT